MEGDEKKRFCAGCGCFVNNIEAMEPDEAEATLRQTGRVCTRVTMDAQRGVLTRAGWVNRLLVAGAVAITVAGCSTEGTNAEAMGKHPDPAAQQTPVKLESPAKDTPTLGKVAAPQPMMGDVATGAVMPNPARPQTTLGTPPLPPKK